MEQSIDRVVRDERTVERMPADALDLPAEPLDRFELRLRRPPQPGDDGNTWNRECRCGAERELRVIRPQRVLSNGERLGAAWRKKYETSGDAIQVATPFLEAASESSRYGGSTPR